jgi:choline dehydrogenase-like flavoprotein
MSEPHYDAIIVGSGAGGGTAARVLTQYGQRVIVFEKGQHKRAEDFLPYDELHFSEHKALIPSKQNDPMVYVNPTDGSRKNVERWWIGNMVGGATMLWEANLPRYTAEDFTPLGVMPSPPADTSQVDWPWTYDEFQPWFEMAEWEWGVSGQAPSPGTAHKQEQLRDGYSFPMPPVRPHASTPFLTWAFARAGMKPFPSPRGINTRTYNGRPGCPYCGYCQGYGCAVNDRASSTNTVLAEALRSGLCTLKTGHCVTRILHKDGRVEGVAYKSDPAGPEQTLKADRVFVSIQAIESARLFLLSGIPDPNKLVGKYLTYHTKGGAELTFKGQPVWDDGPQRLYQPRTSLGSLQMRDLYVIRDKKRPELTKGGKFSIYDPFTISPLIKCVTRAGGAKKAKDLWGKDLVDRLVELRNQGGVMFSFTGETMSLEDNRVELDDQVKDPWGLPVARVHYKHHEYDVAISKYCLERVCEIMTAAGGEIRKFEPQTVANEGYGHNHGSLRAGTDPGASVLDANCQSHTVQGLYVLDSAFMPTSGATNPTLTQIANAYRVCHGLARPA